MKHIMTIGRSNDVLALSYQLRRNHQLWNAHRERTEGEASPHNAVDDIWARYAKSFKLGQKPHESVWYPAYELLPALRTIVFGVCSMVQAERLGGVLITRVPPGHTVQPHQDHGWHAEYYEKFAVQVEAHPQQAFCYDDGQHVTAPGDIFWFNNQETHWVINDSPVDRITLIICARTNLHKEKDKASKTRGA